MTDRHPDDDLLLALALSDIDEQQRDTLTSHLALCEPCRTRYAAIADRVDHVLAAAPRVAPPPGFSKSVLAAMGIVDDGPPARRQHLVQSESSPERSAGPSSPPPTAGVRNRRRAWGRPRVWLAGVAAVLALLVSVAGTAVVVGGSQETGVEVAAVGPALVTGDGARVGTVLDSWYDGQPVLVVTLNNGPVGVRYDCQLVLADGTRQSGGSWALKQESGATWVLARPDTDVTRLELVTDSGNTWATATL